MTESVPSGRLQAGLILPLAYRLRTRVPLVRKTRIVEHDVLASKTLLLSSIQLRRDGFQRGIDEKAYQASILIAFPKFASGLG
jgi:hypothetical protein